jgi:hypothetical protein
LRSYHGDLPAAIEHQVNPAQRILDMSPEERAELRAAIDRRRALAAGDVIEGEAVEAST